MVVVNDLDVPARVADRIETMLIAYRIDDIADIAEPPVGVVGE